MFVVTEPLLTRLKEIAASLGMEVEELVPWLLQRAVDTTDKELEDALLYVLSKNRELYERLAR